MTDASTVGGNAEVLGVRLDTQLAHDLTLVAHYLQITPEKLYTQILKTAFGSDARSLEVESVESDLRQRPQRTAPPRSDTTTRLFVRRMESIQRISSFLETSPAQFVIDAIESLLERIAIVNHKPSS